MLRMNRLARVATLGVLVCCGVLAGVACGAEELWQTNFDAAKAKAKAEKKLLLVDFTGSDWCGWCIKLKQEVFDKEAFQAEAPKQFVLVELDFPRGKKLADDLKKQNDELAKQYKVRGFPTILVLDAEGEVVAKTGYRQGGPEKYVAHLAEFASVYATLPGMRAELKKAEGLERAKLLDRLIEAYGKLGNEIDELEGWAKEIVALDADNKAGLRAKYEFRILMAEAEKLEESEKFSEAGQVLDKVLLLAGLSGEQKQQVYFAQGKLHFQRKDFVNVVASLKKAQEAAPESPLAKNLQDMLKRFGPMGEAQEALVKIQAALPAAKGLERAKLLDQQIEARGKLAAVVRDATLAEDVEKLTQEILSLDPDNKGGLKAKYEFRSLLVKAAKMNQTQEFDKALAALDKALALAALTADQIQEAQLLKGMTYLGQKETEKALECFKKAQEALPDSPKANVIKMLMQRAESDGGAPKLSPTLKSLKKDAAK